MSAYVVFMREKTLDQGELDVYAKRAQTTVAGHEVKVLAFYVSHEDLEGAATEGADPGKAWYDSPLYRKAREHRFKGASYRITVVDGL